METTLGYANAIELTEFFILLFKRIGNAKFEDVI